MVFSGRPYVKKKRKKHEAVCRTGRRRSPPVAAVPLLSPPEERGNVTVAAASCVSPPRRARATESADILVAEKPVPGVATTSAAYLPYLPVHILRGPVPFCSARACISDSSRQCFVRSRAITVAAAADPSGRVNAKPIRSVRARVLCHRRVFAYENTRFSRARKTTTLDVGYAPYSDP